MLSINKFIVLAFAALCGSMVNAQTQNTVMRTPVGVWLTAPPTGDCRQQYYQQAIDNQSQNSYLCNFSSGVWIQATQIYTSITGVPAVSLMGNPTGSIANASAITLGSGLSFSGTTLLSTALVNPMTTSGDIILGGASGVATRSTPTGAGIAILAGSNFTGLNNTTLVPAANTIVDAYQLYDTTTASSGNQQYSPALHFQGRGWETNTSASQPVDVRAYLIPTQGTTNPSGLFTIDEAVNGGAFGPLMQFDLHTQTALFANQNSEAIPAIGFGNNLTTGIGIRGGSYLLNIISGVAYTAVTSNYFGLGNNMQLAWTSLSPYAGTQQTTLYQSSPGVVGFGTSTNNGLGSWLAANGTLSGILTLSTLTTPADNATCTAGTLWVDTGFIYVCTASGTVKRATLATY